MTCMTYGVLPEPQFSASLNPSPGIFMSSPPPIPMATCYGFSTISGGSCKTAAIAKSSTRTQSPNKHMLRARVPTSRLAGADVGLWVTP